MRALFVCVATVAAAALVSGTVAAEILKFDMGTAESPVWEGFRQVTPDTVYERGRGFGWSATDRPGTSSSSHRYRSMPDALYCDWVAPSSQVRLDQGQRPGSYAFSGDMEFLVDLAEGEYRVWLVMECYEMQPGLTYQNAPTTSFAVSAEGDEKLRVLMDEQTWAREVYYAYLSADYRRGDNAFDKYIETRFVPRSFSVSVGDGQLNLVVSNNVLNALIIYPAAEQAEAERLLDQLKRERRAAFPFVLTLPEYDRPKPEPNEVDRSRGYIVFTPHYGVDIYPNYVPARHELSSRMRIYAARGEYEPTTFAIYPLRDLRGCTVSVGDLVSDTARIPAAEVDVRVVRYVEWPARFGGTYTVLPEVLMQRERTDVDAGICKQFWLRVHVPSSARGGLYTAPVRFQPADAAAALLTLQLRVLPFELPDPPGRYHGIWWVNPRFPGGSIADYARDLKSHGMNVVHLGARTRAEMVDGKLQLDFSGWEELLDEYAAAGYEGQRIVVQGAGAQPAFRLTGEPKRYPGYTGSLAHLAKKSFSPEFDRVCVEILRRTQAEAERRGWPQVFFYEAGEGGSEGKWGIFTETHLLQLCRDAGVNGTASINTYPAFVADLPLVSAVQVRPRLLTEAALAQIHATGKPLWFYGCDFRPLRGFYFWRTGAEQAAREATVHGSGVPYDEFDSTTPTWPKAQRTHWPSPDGVLDTPSWEREAEGVDDSRYVHLLEGLLKQAAGDRARRVQQAREQGQQVLDELRRTWRVDHNYYEEAVGWPSGEELDAMRWRVARAIMALKEAMGT